MSITKMGWATNGSPVVYTWRYCFTGYAVIIKNTNQIII